MKIAARMSAGSPSAARLLTVALFTSGEPTAFAALSRNASKKRLSRLGDKPDFARRFSHNSDKAAAVRRTSYDALRIVAGRGEKAIGALPGGRTVMTL